MPARKKVEEIHIVQKIHQYIYFKSKYLPSAPKSGLNDFFSLKFLNIFTTLLLSLIAYLNRDCIVKEKYSASKAANY